MFQIQIQCTQNCFSESHLVFWNELKHEKKFICSVFPTPDRIIKKIIQEKHEKRSFYNRLRLCFELALFVILTFTLYNTKHSNEVHLKGRVL